MKTWLVMRHAKSDWNIPGQDDHDRSLNARGQRDAPLMGKWLEERGMTPDLIVSSTAVRAQSTAAAVAQACGYGAAVQEDARLYLAEPAGFFEVLREIGDEVACVMTVAHNPGCETVIERLTMNEPTMPTAAIAHLELDLDSWAHLDGHTAAWLRDLWRPKEI